METKRRKFCAVKPKQWAESSLEIKKKKKKRSSVELKSWEMILCRFVNTSDAFHITCCLLIYCSYKYIFEFGLGIPQQAGCVWFISELHRASWCSMWAHLTSPCSGPCKPEGSLSLEDEEAPPGHISQQHWARQEEISVNSDSEGGGEDRESWRKEEKKEWWWWWWWRWS